MRQYLVVSNNDAFVAEKRRSEVASLARRELAALPMAASILVGDRRGLFSRMRPWQGYVMLGAKAIGTVTVTPQEVRRGWLEVKD
ncbi:MAG: hypothetical protein ACJ8MR_01160 [Povalibacter sp.]